VSAIQPAPRTPTELEILEREKLLGSLSPEQARRLLENDWVWAKQEGVIWKPPGGGLRRTRFTHGAYFATKRGAFRIDSEGSVRALPAQSSTAAGGPRPRHPEVGRTT
jgi:hypothetical protein